MSDERPLASAGIAENRAASAVTSSPVAAKDRKEVIHALTQDRLAWIDHTPADEERLAKGETQTRVSAQAVVAITQPAATRAAETPAAKDKI